MTVIYCQGNVILLGITYFVKSILVEFQQTAVKSFNIAKIHGPKRGVRL